MRHDIDPAAGARWLVEILEDNRITPFDLGHALDLWLALCGKPTDPDDPGYDDGLREAVSIAYDLAQPAPEPATVTVEQVEVVQGEVL